MKFEVIQPRSLRYRSHYKIYFFGFLIISLMIVAYWFTRFYSDGLSQVFREYSFELSFSVIYFFGVFAFYSFWLRPRLQRAVQVYPDKLVIHNGKHKEELFFSDVESVTPVCWSIFYLKMKSGTKHYFNSCIERVDYIWEGVYKARPDLIDDMFYEEFRLRLVQYDHHQKRKEWFFRHKMVDVFNWAITPVLFLSTAYIIQSRNIVIHQHGIYFFRLFMFAMLVLLVCAFAYSMILKKFVFDRRLSEQLEVAESKIRDLEFEGMILQRSKIFQLVTACFVLGMIIKLDINLYSISKVNEDIASFSLKKGKPILIDNRYNCIGCKYQIHDGDFIVFGRGTIGQVLAKEGDFVGQIAQDDKGRMIASENIQEVPKGHLAVKAANGKDIVFVQIEELIGKIQK